MSGPALLLAVVLAAPASASEASAPDPAPAAADTPGAAETSATPPADAPSPDSTTPDTSATLRSIPAPPGARKTGRGLLIAGGVLTGFGVLGRIALEVYWSTAAQIVPGDPFGRWSVANVALVTNMNNVLFFGTGLGLLTAGARRRGDADAWSGRWRDHRRMRLVGIGLLGGGLGLLALSRALFIPIADACPTNVCAYTTLETTFWIGAGATFAGAAHLAYAVGQQRSGSNVRVRVTPNLAPTFAGLALAGRF